MGAAPILTVSRNGEQIRSVPLDGEAIVGRGEGCVIRLEDRAISRQHAVFRSVGGAVQVEKKSEFAPLSVNGSECSQAVLKEGDVVAIGPYLLKLSMSKSGSSLPELVDLPLLQSASEIDVPVATAFQLAPPPSELVQEGTPSMEGMTPSEPGEPAKASASAQQLPDAGGMLGIAPENPQAEAGALLGPAPDSGGAAEPIAGLGDLGLEVSREIPRPAEPAPPPEPVQLEPGGGAPFGLLPPEPQAAAPESERTNATATPSGFAADENAATRIASAEKVEAKLTLPPGIANLTELVIDKDEISIGRGKDCDIVLTDRKVSRKNTLIRRQGMRFYVRDLGSANGTYVNNVKIDDLPLSSDDLIRIGDAEIRFTALSRDYVDREKDFMPVSQDATPVTPMLSFSPSLGINVPSQAQAQVQAQIQADSDAQAEAQHHQQQRMMAAAAAAMPAVTPIGSTPMGITNGGGLGIQGIAGIGGNSVPANASLLQKFRAMPPKRQAIWGVAILAFVWWFLDDDPVPQAPTKKPGAAQVQAAAGKTSPSGSLAGLTPGAAFDALGPQQKQAVDQWHTLAFDYYTNREYDKALFELRKIFELVPDYKNSRELERYAKEGKRQVEAREEEKRKADEEARVKARLAQLVQEIGEKMSKKQYEQARALFSEVLTLDPDNAEVARFGKELEKVEEQKRLAQQEAEIRKEVVARAGDVYNEAQKLKKQGKYHAAIAEFQKVLEINPDDRKLLARAKAGIASSRAAINALRDPLLADAKSAEDGGELPKAYGLYQKAAKVDPPYPAGWQGMDRIRGVLHERAKALYTEAVLAESYSDFATAKQKFKECLETAPEGDIYHERSQRKLGKFFGRDEASFQ